MNEFIKQNWFKIIIAVAVLGFVLFVGYYFVIFLPKHQIAKTQESINFQEKCSNAAKKFFTDDNWGKLSDTDRIDYTNHYSPKYDQCFILISETSLDQTDKSRAVFQWLYDVFANKEYANITYNNNSMVFCSILVGECKSSTEYNSYVSKYMEN
jgi:hypothetical protein